MSLFSELKRRNVFRVATAYVVASWLIIQVVETILPAYGFGDAAVRLVITALAILFVPTLVFSWAFEITPAGLKREVDVVRERSITRFTGKKIDRIIMALLVLALGYFAFDKFILDPAEDIRIAQSAHQEGRSEAITGSYGDRSIAVLPFVNMSADPEQEYFSDGISEELLNLLAKIPELRVISRTSAFSFKGKDQRISEIAQLLNVNYVLEGSVRRAENQLRVTAQLIDARADTHVWSQTYDREWRDILQIQDDIAESVVAELKVNLFGKASSRHKVSPEAYSLYLQGTHYLLSRGAENLEKSVSAFQAALELEPEYALAWAGLATVIGAQTAFYLRDLEEGYEARGHAVERALRIDDSLPEAHLALATLKLSRDWDWSGALDSLRRAESLDPANPSALFLKASLAEDLGYFDVGIEIRQKLLESDPLNALGHAYLGLVLTRVGRLDEAEVKFRLMHELNPNLGPERDLGWTFLLREQPEKALEEFEQEPDSKSGLQGRAMALHSLGRKAESDAVLDRLIDEFETIAAYQIAEVHAWRNEQDQAFYWLERAREQRSTWMSFILRSVFLVNLEDDSRWEKFLETIGLSSGQRAALDVDWMFQK